MSTRTRPCLVSDSDIKQCFAEINNERKWLSEREGLRSGSIQSADMECHGLLSWHVMSSVMCHEYRVWRLFMNLRRCLDNLKLLALQSVLRPSQGSYFCQLYSFLWGVLTTCVSTGLCNVTLSCCLHRSHALTGHNLPERPNVYLRQSLVISVLRVWEYYWGYLDKSSISGSCLWLMGGGGRHNRKLLVLFS